MGEPIKFGSGLLGNKMVVHDNRVVIISGCFPFKRRRMIPFSAISNVEVPRYINKVVIHTTDGKKASFSVGNAKKMQDAILERM